MKLRHLPTMMFLLAGCAPSAVQVAQQHMMDGDFDTAYAILDSTTTVDPDNGEAFMLLAVIEMRREQFEEARAHLEYAKSVSPEVKYTIERQLEPALAELEAIVWVEFYLEPSVLSRRVARFSGPLEVYRIEERQGPWTRACLRRWLPNDEVIQQYRHGPLINVLFEMPEMAYVEFSAWAASDLVTQRVVQPEEQGVALKVDVVDWVRGKEPGTALVFGTVTNYGTATARGPMVRIVAAYLDLDIDTMGFSGAAGDPLGPMPPAVLAYIAGKALGSGQADVDIRPQLLRPGETGIIVMTMTLPGENILLQLDVKPYHAEDPPPVS